MPDLLLELFSEEIPATMQRISAENLRKLVTSKFTEAGLTYESACEYWTPCRLVLDLRGLITKSADHWEERKGPSVHSSQTAIDGFLRATNLDNISQAEIATDLQKGRQYYVVRTKKNGRKAQEIAAMILPKILNTFPWKKSMRWGEESSNLDALRWIRPLRSILCLFSSEIGSEIINFNVGSLSSKNQTYGHRFMGREHFFSVRGFEDYAEKLEKEKVVLDANRRKEIILATARTLSFERGLELVEDERLAEEVTGLTEWPIVLMGKFEEKYLSIPPEIIRLTIRINQKCFVTRKRGEKTTLSNHFILVSNIEAKDGGKMIVTGNTRVIQARLADALHFWHSDQISLPDLEKFKLSAEKFGLDLKKPLDQRMARLDSLEVIFHEKLGTQGERVARITALVEDIAPLIGANITQARRAALLAKADLQTNIVNEFPELQGVIGRKYALLQGEHENIARALEEHYKPLGATDTVPNAPVSIALALSDKIDTLAGFWLVDEKPTSSRDPYALRRAALGIIRLILSQKKTIYLLPLFRKAILNVIKYRHDNHEYYRKISSDVNPILHDLLSFMHERLRIYLHDSGIHHDILKAVFSEQEDDFLRIVLRGKALLNFLKNEEGKRFFTEIKRVINILEIEKKKKPTDLSSITTSLFVEDEEEMLYNTLLTVEKTVSSYVAAEKFFEAYIALLSLTNPIYHFFEKILINDKNINIRTNRLTLLSRVRLVAELAGTIPKMLS